MAHHGGTEENAKGSAVSLRAARAERTRAFQLCLRVSALRAGTMPLCGEISFWSSRPEGVAAEVSQEKTRRGFPGGVGWRRPLRAHQL